MYVCLEASPAELFLNIRGMLPRKEEKNLSLKERLSMSKPHSHSEEGKGRSRTVRRQLSQQGELVGPPRVEQLEMGQAGLLCSRALHELRPRENVWTCGKVMFIDILLKRPCHAVAHLLSIRGPPKLEDFWCIGNIDFIILSVYLFVVRF